MTRLGMFAVSVAVPVGESCRLHHLEVHISGDAKMVEVNAHSAYVAPKLTRFGTFREITLCEKYYGLDDGFTWAGNPITCGITTS